MDSRAQRRASRFIPIFFLVIAGLSSSAACHHAQNKPTAPSPTFHYRSQAHLWELDKRYSSKLDGSDPMRGTDAVRLHFSQAGVLQVSSSGNSEAQTNVQVLLFNKGKVPLKRGHAGETLSVPVDKGDLFVVVHATRGTGPGAVELIASFSPAAAHEPVEVVPGAAPPAAPAPAADTIELGMAPAPVPEATTNEANDLPLDDL